MPICLQYTSGTEMTPQRCMGEINERATAGIRWGNVVDKVWREIGGKQEKTYCPWRTLGGVQDRNKERMGKREG